MDNKIWISVIEDYKSGFRKGHLDRSILHGPIITALTSPNSNYGLGYYDGYCNVDRFSYVAISTMMKG